jgi:hypothetical protein
VFVRGSEGARQVAAHRRQGGLKGATVPGGQLSGTAAPEALAGVRSQQERGYNKAGAGGFQWSTSVPFRVASGPRQVFVRGSEGGFPRELDPIRGTKGR